jgi:hypothetical protein
VERSETSEKTQKFLSRDEDHPGFPNNACKYRHYVYFIYIYIYLAYIYRRLVLLKIDFSEKYRNEGEV